MGPGMRWEAVRSHDDLSLHSNPMALRITTRDYLGNLLPPNQYRQTARVAEGYGGGEESVLC